MSGSTSDLLFVGLFPVIFVAAWLGTTLLIAKLGGWTRLEEFLPDRSGLPLETLRFERLYLGQGKLGTSYRGCVTFVVTKDGLRVSIWKLFAPFSHPIFIPWDRMDVEAARIMMFSAIRLKIGPGGSYWMTISESTAKRIARASRGAFDLPFVQ